MSDYEIVLIALMRIYKSKSQRTMMLQSCVQKYGPLSQEAWEKVNAMLAEVKE